MKRLTAFFLSFVMTLLSWFGVSFQTEDGKMLKLLLTEQTASGEDANTRALQKLFDAVKLHVPTVRVCGEKKPFADDDRVQAIFFDGEDVGGTPCEVFAYLGFPAEASAEHPVPAMVLLHGGSGHADAEWVQYWLDRGYAAIAVDGFGQEPADGLYSEDGWTVNPDSHCTIDEFRSIDKPITQQWFYYFITDVLLSNNILRADARVQKDKIGLTGISWGGIGTTVAMSYDDRFAFAVPVYGCGFLYGSSALGGQLVNDKVRDLWEPSKLLRSVQMPVLYIVGDDDPFFSADAVTASAANVRNGQILLIPSYPHGHSCGAYIPEIVHFANEQCGEADSNLKITTASFDGEQLVLDLDVPDDAFGLRACLYTRTAPLYYKDMKLIEAWNKQSGILVGDKVRFKVPADAKMFYVTVQGKRGTHLHSEQARVSTGVYSRDQLLNEGYYRHTLNKQQLAENITKSVQAYVQAGKIGGAELLVNQDGSRVFEGVFGLRTVGQEALQPNAMYRLASMTKPITAVALLMEYERGRINLYADVSDYLDGYEEMDIGKMENGKIVSVGKAKNSVKVYQLVSHTSGIGSGSVGNSLYDSLDLSKMTVQSVAEYFATQPLSFDPGTKAEYSTAAFDVAARIIEIVSGMPYDEYLKENLFDRLGMTDTTFTPSGAQWERMVTMHDRDEQGNSINGGAVPTAAFVQSNTAYFGAGGGLCSTAEDYMKFAEMLLHEGKAADGTQILSAEMVRLMRTPHVSAKIMPGSTRWGLGVRVVVEDGDTLPIGSFGWSGAFGTHYWVDPSNRITAVYMKNSLYDGGSGSDASAQFEIDVMNALQ